MGGRGGGIQLKLASDEKCVLVTYQSSVSAPILVFWFIIGIGGITSYRDCMMLFNFSLVGVY